jgi:hypothetical protein
MKRVDLAVNLDVRTRFESEGARPMTRTNSASSAAESGCRDFPRSAEAAWISTTRSAMGRGISPSRKQGSIREGVSRNADILPIGLSQKIAF